MKKLLLAVVAMTMTASAFAAGENMVRLYGFDTGARAQSVDFRMASDDAEEGMSYQNIALNYARAFGQWQVGLTYKSASLSDNSGNESGGTTMGLSGYYNLDSDLQNTCYFALHYLTHTPTADGGYADDNSGLGEDLAEDDTATSIVLEYGHRWSIGTGWGFNVTYAPSVMYTMNTYSFDNEAFDDSKGASETNLAWNFLKFDVMF